MLGFAGMKLKKQTIKLGLKRAADVTGAATMLVVLSPVMAFAALAVKSQGIGSVLFKQQRYGKGQQPFTMYKFRSMRDGADQAPEDMARRVTPVTRWLRKYSVDELPQLFNVLRGDMSLIGPRPSGQLKPYGDIYDMRPGLTGLAQISGRNMLEPEKRAELERRYVQSWSLRKDLRILVGTMPVWLRAQGYAEPDSPVYVANVQEQKAQDQRLRVIQVNGAKHD